MSSYTTNTTKLQLLNELKRLQRKIKRYEQGDSQFKLEEALENYDNIHEVFYRSDREGRLTMCSSSSSRMFGYSTVEDMIGLPIDVIWPDPAGQDIMLYQIHTSGAVYDYEVTLVRRNGSSFPASLSAHCCFDETGTVQGTEGIIRDMTERKRIENALRESQKKYKSIFDNIQEVFYRSDRVDRLILCNPYSLKIFGYANIDEVIGMPLHSFWYHPSEREIVISRLRESGTIRDYETIFVRKNGTPFPGSLNAQYYYDEAGTILGTEGFMTDITERKRTEEHLKSSMEQLHMLTSRLESIREEERKSISREVHDDLGQILTALTMDLMEIQKAAPSSVTQIKEKVESALSLSDSAIKIVQDVSARLRPSMLDHLGLCPAIGWLVEEFQKRSGINCILELPMHEPYIDGERSTALYRTLQEALTNVARHAKANHVRVSFIDTAEAYTMQIIDDGIGITEMSLNDPKSIGLLGIRERLRPYKGECMIQRGSTCGTEVFIHLPKIIS